MAFPSRRPRGPSRGNMLDSVGLQPDESTVSVPNTQMQPVTAPDSSEGNTGILDQKRAEFEGMKDNFNPARRRYKQKMFQSGMMGLGMRSSRTGGSMSLNPLS